MSDRIKAFPVSHTLGYKEGMDLRDYIATAALQGILSGQSEGLIEMSRDGIDPISEVAWAAYEYADAMMKARQGRDR